MADGDRADKARLRDVTRDICRQRGPTVTLQPGPCAQKQLGDLCWNKNPETTNVGTMYALLIRAEIAQISLQAQPHY